MTTTTKFSIGTMESVEYSTGFMGLTKDFMNTYKNKSIVLLKQKLSDLVALVQKCKIKLVAG
eukprot:m.72215 g.72215  ORF g.72215 m.72215 type:complete len:62 (-) comp12310_c0_seq4:114-299(-)